VLLLVLFRNAAFEESLVAASDLSRARRHCTLSWRRDNRELKNILRPDILPTVSIPGVATPVSGLPMVGVAIQCYGRTVGDRLGRRRTCGGGAV
jgi:hypothetical protein